MNDTEFLLPNRVRGKADRAQLHTVIRICSFNVDQFGEYLLAIYLNRIMTKSTILQIGQNTVTSLGVEILLNFT